MTQINGATALVTGGNRGIGEALVRALYERGAAKVYATARDPRTVTHPDAVALPLEVTDASSVAELARAAGDVTILVNNAGVTLGTSYLESPVEQVQREFDINFFGPLRTTRAFAPIIERNGGGHVLNMHSALSWVAWHGAYSATKSALWSQSNALRVDLKPRGIVVSGLHVGYVDTDMTAGVDAPKTTPDRVAELALDGIEADRYEILVDDVSRQVKAALSGDLTALYPSLAA